MFRSILVAADGSSATSGLALERAVELASRLGAPLHVVSVVPDLAVGAASDASAAALAERHTAMEKGAVAALERAGELCAERGVTVTTHLERGEPAVRIVAVADHVDAELVVIGSKGLNPAGHYVLGSVPEQVLLTARSHPVLVIRTS